MEGSPLVVLLVALGAWLLITLFAVALMRAAARADAVPFEPPVDLARYRLTHPRRSRAPRRGGIAL